MKIFMINKLSQLINDLQYHANYITVKTVITETIEYSVIVNSM